MIQHGNRVRVWISPSAKETARPVARLLKSDFELIVVPKTGTRTADVAVLCDPQPQEVRQVRSILADVPLLALITATPSAVLVDAFDQTQTQIMVRPAPISLIDRIRQMSKHS